MIVTIVYPADARYTSDCKSNAYYNGERFFGRRGKIPDHMRSVPFIDDNGSTRVIGGEVVQKKYGLVAGDLRRQPDSEEQTSKTCMLPCWTGLLMNHKLP